MRSQQGWKHRWVRRPSASETRFVNNHSERVCTTEKFSDITHVCCCRTRKREGGMWCRRYTTHPFARTHTHRQTASSCRLLKGERDTTTSDARQRRKFMTTTLPMPTPMGPGLLLEQTGLYSSNAKKKFEGGEGASHQKRVERVHTDRTTQSTPVRIIATVGTYHSLLGLVILSGWGGRRCTQQGFKPATHTHTGTPTPPR